MITNLKKVFLRLQKVNLKLNPKKCVLFGKEIKYLGRIISASNMTTEKIAVKDWSISRSKKHLRSNFSRVLFLLS